MGLLVYDTHGLWTLNVLHGFNTDGSLRRGYYSKKTNEADQSLPSIEIAASLVRLEDVEKLAAGGNPELRAAMLHDSKYRGALIYAAVDDTTVNYGELYTRMTAAKNAYDAVYAEAVGGPIHGEPDAAVTSPFVTPETAVTEPLPRWQALGFESKQAWKDAGRP